MEIEYRALSDIDKEADVALTSVSFVSNALRGCKLMEAELT